MKIIIKMDCCFSRSQGERAPLLHAPSQKLVNYLNTGLVKLRFQFLSK